MAKQIHWIFGAIPITSEVHKEEIQDKSRVFSLWRADPRGPWAKPNKQTAGWFVPTWRSLQASSGGLWCCPKVSVLKNATFFFMNIRGIVLWSSYPPAVLAYLLLLKILLASSWCRFISSVISSGSRRHHSRSSGRLRLEIGKGITKGDNVEERRATRRNSYRRWYS